MHSLLSTLHCPRLMSSFSWSFFRIGLVQQILQLIKFRVAAYGRAWVYGNDGTEYLYVGLYEDSCHIMTFGASTTI